MLVPGSYLIDVADGIVYTRTWGMLADDEIIAHAETLKADDRFRRTFRQIALFVDATGIILTAEAIRSVATNNPFPPSARRAFVVSTDEAYGLARMFMLYLDADPKQFGIFRDMESAWAWIGLDPSTPWPQAEPDRVFEV
jgi:hypothetical protein